MVSRAAHAIGLIVVCAALAACGYHLRGMGDAALSFTTVAIEGGDNDPLLVERVKDTFARANITVVNEGFERQVKILGANQSRKASAVDAGGNVAIYALDYVMTFSFFDAQGAPLLESAQVTAHREYEFNEQEILGKDEEQQLLLREMRGDLARDLLRRISRAERKRSG